MKEAEESEEYRAKLIAGELWKKEMLQLEGTLYLKRLFTIQKYESPYLLPEKRNSGYKKEGKEEDSSGPDFQENLGKTHYITDFSILQINTLYLTDFFSPHPAACNHASTVVK